MLRDDDLRKLSLSDADLWRNIGKECHVCFPFSWRMFWLFHIIGRREILEIYFCHTLYCENLLSNDWFTKNRTVLETKLGMLSESVFKTTWKERLKYFGTDINLDSRDSRSYTCTSSRSFRNQLQSQIIKINELKWFL